MDWATVALWALAAVLLVAASRRSADGPGELLVQGAQVLLVLVPRLVLAVLIAGFAGAVVPGEVIAAWIGGESGFYGVLLASVLGGIVPGGPIISFPIVVVLKDAGAGLPQLIAFLTAWSVLALHRVLIYETTLLGWRFSALRLGASLMLAPLVGLAVELLLALH